MSVQYKLSGKQKREVREMTNTELLQHASWYEEYNNLRESVYYDEIIAELKRRGVISNRKD